jgi:hypothetical protein
MRSAGFESAIPTIKRPQTYALDRTATEIGCISRLVRSFWHKSTQRFIVFRQNSVWATVTQFISSYQLQYWLLLHPLVLQVAPRNEIVPPKQYQLKCTLWQLSPFVCRSAEHSFQQFCITSSFAFHWRVSPSCTCTWWVIHIGTENSLRILWFRARHYAVVIRGTDVLINVT